MFQTSCRKTVKNCIFPPPLSISYSLLLHSSVNNLGMKKKLHFIYIVGMGREKMVSDADVSRKKRVYNSSVCSAHWHVPRTSYQKLSSPIPPLPLTPTFSCFKLTPVHALTPRLKVHHGAMGGRRLEIVGIFPKSDRLWRHKHENSYTPFIHPFLSFVLPSPSSTNNTCLGNNSRVHLAKQLSTSQRFDRLDPIKCHHRPLAIPDVPIATLLQTFQLLPVLEIFR